MLKLFLIALCFYSELMAQELKMRDAVVRVELHDRSGRVEMGRGFFVSGLGEFIVPHSVVAPARKNPYGYLMSFKTVDGIPLSDVTFSHCDKDEDSGLCYYKANYVPYRKIDLSHSEGLENHQQLLFHRTEKGIGTVQIEHHPSGEKFWSNSKNSEGRIPGTLLFDRNNKPIGMVMSKRLRESDLVLPLKHLTVPSNVNYHPIEQQTTNTLPTDLQKESHNMTRMVGDLTRMTQEELKKALEQLFVPGGKGARSGIGRRQTNNQLQKQMKEDVILQAAARGEEARRDFFKVEQQALDLENQVQHDEKEVGDLEKKIEGKKGMAQAIEMQQGLYEEQLIAAQVKLEVNGDKLSGQEKEELNEQKASAEKKLNELKGKKGKLGNEIGELEKKLADLKKGLAQKRAQAQAMQKQANEMAQKNGDTLQGNHSYRGDLL